MEELGRGRGGVKEVVRTGDKDEIRLDRMTLGILRSEGKTGK